MTEIEQKSREELEAYIGQLENELNNFRCSPSSERVKEKDTFLQKRSTAWSKSETGRILVVDDDQSIRVLVSKILGKESYDLAEAASGEEAIALCGRMGEAVDVVLLDINMDGVGGFEVLDAIKSNPVTENAVVIMLTAVTSVEDKVKAFKLGAVDYLPKPFSRDELRARIRVHLDNKRMEEALRESEKNYRELSDLLPQTVFEIDLEGNFTFVNRYGLQFTGYTRDDIDNGTTKAWDLFIEEDRERVAHNIVMRFMGDTGNSVEDHQYTMLKKDGSTVPIAVYSAPVFRNDQWSGLRGMVLDLTEWKESENAALTDATRYESLFKADADAIFLFDRETFKVVDVNPSALALYGYSREEILAIHPRDITVEEEETNQAIRGAADVPLRYHRKKDGTVFPVEISNIPLDFEGGSLMLSKMRDIAERIDSEERLKASSEKLASAQRVAGMGSYEMDVATGLVTMSDEMYRIYGITPEQFDGTFNFIVENFIHPDDIALVTTSLGNAVETGTTVVLEYRILRPDGSIRYICANSEMVYDAEGNLTQFIGTAQDVTKRKQAEESLRESEDRLNRMFTFTDHMVCIADLETGYFTKLSPAFSRHLNWTEEEMLSKPILDFIHPDDVQKTADCIKEQMDKGIDVIQFENRYRTKEGSFRCFEWSANPVPEEGITYSAAYDITERKKAEDALRFSEQLLAESQKIANIGSWVWNLKSRKVSWSDQLFVIHGREKDSGVPSADSSFELYHPDDRDKVQSAFETAIKNDAVCEVDYRIIRENDGEQRWLHGHGNIEKDEAGQMIRMIGITQDITERKWAEELLQIREQYYRALIENSSDGIVVTDANGRGMYTEGRSRERILGYSAEDNDQDLFGHVHPDDIESAMKVFLELVNKPGETERAEVRLKHRNGEWVDLEITGQNLLDDPAVRGMVIHYRDITERIQYEESLTKSQAELTRAQQIAHIGSWSWDFVSNIISWSDEMYHIYGLAMEMEPSNDFVRSVVHPDDIHIVDGAMATAFEQKRLGLVEHRVLRPDKTEGHVQVRTEVICGDFGNVVQMFGTVQDITLQREAEKQLKEKLAELERYKEVTVGRELKMIELKEQLRVLKKELGRANPE